MSRELCEAAGVIGDQVAVDDLRELPLEAPEGFAGALSLGELADVVIPPRSRMHDLNPSGKVQGVVERAVVSPSMSSSFRVVTWTGEGLSGSHACGHLGSYMDHGDSGIGQNRSSPAGFRTATPCSAARLRSAGARRHRGTSSRRGGCRRSWWRARWWRCRCRWSCPTGGWRRMSSPKRWRRARIGGCCWRPAARPSSSYEFPGARTHMVPALWSTATAARGTDTLMG